MKSWRCNERNLDFGKIYQASDQAILTKNLQEHGIERGNL